jgi:cytoskeletal protein CcmA (bactofilin family)
MAMFKQRNEPVEPGAPIETRRETPSLKVDPSPPAASRKHETAVVGSTIHIQGELTGDEDLMVHGRIEGTVTLKNHALTVGKDGHVNATVDAKTIRIEGAVEGDLRGKEQVIVTRTGGVHGNIAAPRVTLEDGCRFKGSIDMEGSGAGGTGKVTDIMLGASVADESGKSN